MLDFELTISGLCVIVLKSKTDPRPTQPDAVEVLCVGGGHQHGGQGGHGQGGDLHRPCLSFWPEDMDFVDKAWTEPDLFVDPLGRRIACVDLTNASVSFGLGSGSQKKFSLTWGAEDAEKPPQEEWMNWIAPVQDLGVTKLNTALRGRLPHGVITRLTLPPGDLKAKDIIRDGDNNPYLWKLEGGKRSGNARIVALANQVSYTVNDASEVIVVVDGKNRLISTSTSGRLSMSFSNDLRNLPRDYNLGAMQLDHLGLIKNLALDMENFKVPELASIGRTGKPICNQLLYVDQA